MRRQTLKSLALSGDLMALIRARITSMLGTGFKCSVRKHAAHRNVGTASASDHTIRIRSGAKSNRRKFLARQLLATYASPTHMPID